MDKKKVPKKQKVPKSKVKKTNSTKKIQHKGGAENIGTSTAGLFTSFFDFGKAIFNEIDLLTNTPAKLGKIAN